MRTYGTLQLAGAGDRWMIPAVEPHVAIRLKQLFPRIPKAGVPPYFLDRSPMMDADLHWFTSRYPLAISQQDADAMASGKLAFEVDQAEMERILLPTYEGEPIGGIRSGFAIRPYQQQAIDLLRRRKRLLLGDEGGLGKTYTAAGFLCAEPDALPAAVICDAHLQEQWREKVEGFTTLRVHKIRAVKPYTLPKADVYVFRISQIRGWSNIFNEGFFRSAIFDEVQSLRTGAFTAKGAAAAVLSRRTAFQLGLTATPIYNYGSEIWNVMQFIDGHALDAKEDFDREWAPTGGIADPKALGTYLRERYVFLRRLKSDVGQELPKVSRIIEHVDYDAKTLASIDSLAHTLALKATTGNFIERGSAARDLDILVRQHTGIAKAKQVAMFARLMVEADEPVVLWGWHREVYRIWNEELADLNPAMYTGSESIAAKKRTINTFLAGETKLLIMSLRSGQGVDGLQNACSTGIFGELDWSPGIHQQCIWRLDREGQTKPVTAFFLVTNDGSDPPMMEVLGIKASEATNITDPHLGVQTVDVDLSNMRRLVARYLEKKRMAA